MSIFLCQANGDLAIVNNQLWMTDNSVSTVAAVAAVAPLAGQETLQLIRNNLRMGLGEEPLDLALGTPWLQQIMVKGVPTESVEAILYAIILGTPGVQKVNSLTATLNPVTRSLTVSFSAQLIAGGTVTSTETFP